MTTERPYAAAVPVEEALEEIRRGSGGQFAPVVAEALLRVFERDPAEFGAHRRHATV
jgi:HD-GYP domain-containing protein (c-di-GMP phosphodiesterase class II)